MADPKDDFDWASGLLGPYIPLIVGVGSYVLNTIYSVLEDHRKSR